jgi:ATP-dependent Clp protease ATP-binding subunit ClpC
MFERYTEEARRLIFFARYEASLLGAQYIGPPHLLLGMLRDDKGLFVMLLGTRNPFENAVELMGLNVTGRKANTSVDIPLSLESKRVLAFAAEESQRLEHEQIAPGHLLLGLLREPGAACDLLEKSGLTLAVVREALTGKASPPANQRIIADLRSHFGVMLDRLTPELEPAVVYSPRREKA